MHFDKSIILPTILTDLRINAKLYFITDEFRRDTKEKAARQISSNITSRKFWQFGATQNGTAYAIMHTYLLIYYILCTFLPIHSFKYNSSREQGESWTSLIRFSRIVRVYETPRKSRPSRDNNFVPIKTRMTPASCLRSTNMRQDRGQTIHDTFIVCPGLH